ncbi:MAG: hypothetical protein IJL09_10865 [Lachnospiraceae bacterium]|nr:hypothetical protein [Lachnospiraceae bacterium]
MPEKRKRNTGKQSGLPEREKWISSKQKGQKMLAWEAKKEHGQARKAENACLRSEKGTRASKESGKCLPEKRKRNTGKQGRQKPLAHKTKMKS